MELKDSYKTLSNCISELLGPIQKHVHGLFSYILGSMAITRGIGGRIKGGKGGRSFICFGDGMGGRSFTCFGVDGKEDKEEEVSSMSCKISSKVSGKHNGDEDFISNL